ncbi:hypothetical protein SASPL_154371 [Salvia splendens]|uniref:Uncharacterized protein n=1 Tax=Salvia splendens TaxID=180675 RepID=A0A8X8W002_SALSN|nr:hypothetical protein SASPL_154371 [Salvia splendens]
MPLSSKTQKRHSSLQPAAAAFRNGSSESLDVVLILLVILLELLSNSKLRPGLKVKLPEQPSSIVAKCDTSQSVPQI